MWANCSGDYTDHSPSWAQACFQAVTAWKKAGASQPGNRRPLFSCRPSRRGSSLPRPDSPAPGALGHSRAQAPQPLQFFIPWQRLTAKMPVATPLPSLIMQAGTVLMPLQAGTASAGGQEQGTKVW